MNKQSIIKLVLAGLASLVINTNCRNIQICNKPHQVKDVFINNSKLEPYISALYSDSGQLKIASEPHNEIGFFVKPDRFISSVYATNNIDKPKIVMDSFGRLFDEIEYREYFSLYLPKDYEIKVIWGQNDE